MFGLKIKTFYIFEIFYNAQHFTLSHSIPARKEELQPFCPHYSSSPANRPYLPVIMYMPHLPSYSRAPQALANVKKQHARSTTRSTKITKAPTMFFLRAYRMVDPYGCWPERSH